MEQIKITDKVTLRQEALRLAMELSKSHAKCVADTINNAITFAKYIQGSAELPERDNGMEKYLQEMKDMLFKQHNPWISADSEMKPYEDAIVLVRCDGYENPQLGKYLGEDYWEVRAEKVLQSKFNEVNVVAWMPIPPFTQPTL